MSENTPSTDATEVFLFIENRLVRETLVRLFRKQTDLRMAAQGPSTETLDLVNSHCNIVVLDDLKMLSPLWARLLNGQKVNGKVGIVMVGMEEDEEQFLLAVRSGVSGYLLNDASASDVVGAVRTAARGEAVCPPRLCFTLFRAVARLARETPAQRGPLPSLTIHQQQIISLVAKGMTNKEIAGRLNLSEFTIKNHMHRIMKQVEAVTRQEAVAAARASGYPLAA